MTELKTLENIPLGEYTDDLRREAIKWIKFFRNPPSEHIGYALEDSSVKGLVNIKLSIDEDWIKHFFNITEEELK